MKPILKWVGGKRQLLPKILELMPNSYNAYYEPFVGGGALFFELAPKSAVINDFNKELSNLYKCFQNEKVVSKLLNLLDEHVKNHSEEYYYIIRNMDRSLDFATLEPYVKGARTIYLNKACFNGLYRVNSKGYFNAPSGHKDKVVLYDKDNVDAIVKYFKESNVSILNVDFERAVETAKEGDFVYFDPPYDSVDDKKSFASYTKDGFDKVDQKRLKKVVDDLTKKGVKCMISNHNTEYIRSLYKDYNVHIVNAKRLVNSDKNGRGDVDEVIITNY